jgi:formylglycine-generating enzyme required for sulfatase activity
MVAPDDVATSTVAELRGEAAEHVSFSQAITKKDKLGCEYAYVPKMRFLRGETRQIDEIRAPFYLARYPVTKAQFLEFLRDTGYDYSPIHLQLMDRISPDPDCPATPISWWDAKYYIRWLRYRTQEYYSLPTEAEWEATCRGTDGRRYPWGNANPTDLHACFSAGKVRETTDIVGTHPLGNSPFNCCDLVGNVWEWCLDSVDEEGEIHVLRGGSCQESISSCTCTSRSFISPANLRVNYAGFRVIYLPDAMFEEYCRAHSL